MFDTDEVRLVAGTADDHSMVQAFARHRHQARAEVVGEIVAWLQDWSCSSCGDVGRLLGGQIEDDFLEQKKNTFLQGTTADTLNVPPKE